MTILNFFLTKHLTKVNICIIFRFVKGSKADDQVRKHLWGPGIQTPSYILSPLDRGPQNIFLECPISFSPFLPFGAFGNTAGNGGIFFRYKNYFSNTEKISQCALPTNWSTGIKVHSLYPPRVNVSISRRNVCGLQET